MKKGTYLYNSQLLNNMDEITGKELINKINDSRFYKRIIFFLIVYKGLTPYKMCNQKENKLFIKGDEDDFRKSCKELVNLHILNKTKLPKGERYTLKYDIILDLFLYMFKDRIKKIPSKRDLANLILLFKSSFSSTCAVGIMFDNESLLKKRYPALKKYYESMCDYIFAFFVYQKLSYAGTGFSIMPFSDVKELELFEKKIVPTLIKLFGLEKI